jgi:hypothetical protein
VDPASFSTFSVLDKSRHAERRLLARFLPAFDDILAFIESRQVIFTRQVDVTREWKNVLDNTVAAISWDLFTGMDVVLVMFDDPEFGKNITWFLGPESARLVDFKLLLVFIETCMEIVLVVLKDPSILEKINGMPRCDVSIVDRDNERIKSPSFCLAFDSNAMIPARLEQWADVLAQVKEKPPLGKMLFMDPLFKQALFCWQVLHALRACVARDVPCMGRALHVRIDKPILMTGDVSRLLLTLIKIHLEIITGLFENAIPSASTSSHMEH